MFCRYCGSDLPNDSAFCFSCGKALATEAIVQATPIARDRELVRPVPPPPPSGFGYPAAGDFAAQKAPPNKNAKSIVIAILAIPLGIVTFMVSMNSIRYFWGGDVTLQGAIFHAVTAGIAIGLFSLLLYVRPRTMQAAGNPEIDPAGRRPDL
jgi:hypothetical protein